MIWFVVIAAWILVATLITVGQNRRAQWPQHEERQPPELPPLRDRDRDVRTSLNWPR